MYDQKISKGLCSKLASDGKYFDATDGETNDLANFIDSWRFAKFYIIKHIYFLCPEQGIGCLENLTISILSVGSQS